MRSTCLLLALGFLAGPLAAQGVPVKTVRPVVVFGGLNDDPDLEMVEVTRSVMTANGSFVVANGKPKEIRHFSRAGKFLNQIGHPGGGPGEFKYAADIRPWQGDSVLAYSVGTQRWMLFTLAGKLVREWPADAAHPLVDGVTLERAAWVRHWLPGSRGCPYTLASRFSGALGHPSEVLSDAAGRVWRHDPDRAEIWHVYSAAGKPMVDLRLPVGLRIQQFSGNRMVAVRQDDDGADHLVMFELPLAPVPANALPRCAAPPQARAPALDNLRTDTRNAMTAGEAMRSDLHRYPKSREDLPANFFQTSGNNKMRVLSGGIVGWAFVISSEDPSGYCMMATGATTLPGWPSGLLACHED